MGKIAAPIIPPSDGIAARAKNGHVVIALTNLDATETVDLTLAVQGPPVRSAIGEVSTAPAVDSANIFGELNVVSPKPVSIKASGGRVVLRLPPKSVTVVQVDQ